jgi:hypothetical protein
MPKTDVTVNLIGINGNSFSIMGTVSKALRKGGHDDIVGAYCDEAMSGDYDHLLQVTMGYVNVK